MTNPLPPVELELVVIGSGCSGTGWAARALTALGAPCGHESVFDWQPGCRPDRRIYRDGNRNPYEPPRRARLRAEASMAAIAYLSVLSQSVLVWHLARDPLATVRSFASTTALDVSTPYGRFMHAHVPELASELSQVGKAARWVAEWNLRGARACAALGLAYQLDQLEDVAPPTEAVNMHARCDTPAVTWETIDAEATRETAELLREWFSVAGY